jgi:hypothetical protein
MIRRLFFAVLACSMFAALLPASDVSGTWVGLMAFGDNQFNLTYIFKQEGDKLTGVVNGPNGDLPLADGQVHGDKLSFAVNVEVNGNPTKFTSEGTLKGEEIVLTTKGGAFGAGSVTLKRSK